ncbi:SpoIIE family protein phosphatase [Streptomyces griseochromogenes]|uniref:SpoIIE family protein phosphatase n=1 Tax=Streptomyces griseochromogenes TaxID=68214 RepID=UPI00379137D9
MGISESPGRLSGDGGSLDDALGAGLTDVVRCTGASIGGLYLIEERRPVLRLVALCGLPVEFSAPWQRLPLTAPVPVADAIRQDRLVWIGSHDEMARRYPRTAAVLPYRFALAAIALTGVSRCWGGIVLMWPAGHPREASSRERGNLTASAHRLARLLDESPRPLSLPEQPRLFAVGRPSHPVQTGMAAADYLERLPEGAVALDLEGRITFVSTAAARMLGREPEGLLGTRPWQALPWLDDPVYEDQYRTAVISRAPAAFDVLRPPDQWLTFRIHPDSSGISVRITPRGEQAAPSAAPAGPRASQAPTGRLYQLVHLAAALTETVTVRDLVALVADQVLPAFGAQGLVLSAVDAGRLMITGHHGYPADVMERLDALPFDTSLTPAGDVLARGTPAFFASRAQLADAYPEAPRMSDKQAWAFLPLLITGRPVGCCILSYDRPHAFTADERAIMTSLAGLLAQALDRARLFDTQHRLVHELQRALLPRTLRTVPGLDVTALSLPAGHGVEVGGDFYDLLRLDDSTAAAVIGDVEGHSVASAALMGQVRTAIHAHASAGATPDLVLARTNQLLVDLDCELLVACLYAQVDLIGHRVTLASAGHVPPLLRVAPHHAHVLDVEPGPLLGIGAAVRYPVTAATLPDQAILALHTDGLVELPGSDVARATSALVGHLADADDRDLRRLADSLVRHAWPTGQHTDDITVLLLRAMRERT